ncbi:MAG: hypothetical protein MUO76_05875 [Anaerolineaceae bacterium]|nr:hypothetical protein [Anaerolineaceae bacterium]
MLRDLLILGSAPSSLQNAPHQFLTFHIMLLFLKKSKKGNTKMSFLRKLFGKQQVQQPPSAPDHAVLVYFTYGSIDLSRLFTLEGRLEESINTSDVGVFDGNEIATDGTDGVLYMYGPDADALFDAVRPALETADFMKGALVKLRYGPPQDGVREKEVFLGT